MSPPETPAERTTQLDHNMRLTNVSPIRQMNSGSVSNPPESLILSKQKSSDARIGINAAAASQSQVKTCQIISAGKNITVMADQNIAIKDLISKK